MKSLIAVALCCALPLTSFAASDDSYKVVYDGGSLPGIKAGKDVKLHIATSSIVFKKDKEELIAIPTSSVTEISYGQDVHRRVGAAIGLALVVYRSHKLIWQLDMRNRRAVLSD